MLKRRKIQKTNYKKRIALIKSGETRLVVRKSLNSFTIQFINYETEGDKTVVEVNSRSLVKMGWKGHTGNTSSAYLAGLIAGKKAKEKGIKLAVLDMGLQLSTKGNSIYAVVKGVNDSGVKVPFDESIAPANDRIAGAYAQNKESVSNFEEIKKKIESGIKIPFNSKNKEK